MSVAISPETQHLLENAVREGGYENADQLIRAGIISLTLRTNTEEFEAGELDQLLEAGEASGEALDGDAVFAELRNLQNRTQDTR